MAVLTRLAQRDLAAKEVAHELHPVTNAQHRYAQLEDGGIGMRGGLRIYALGATGEDDANHAGLPEFGRRRAEVVDLRVNLALADAAGDNLRQLGTEIENGDCLCHAKL